MKTADASDLIFKALAAAIRRDILDLLRDHPRTTGELCAAFPHLDRCTVMQHLGVLEETDLIIVQRQGRERWNYLNPLPIKHIHDRWIGAYAASAVTLLDRLQTDLGANTTESGAFAQHPGDASARKTKNRSKQRART